MKTRHRNSATRDEQLGAADELIREVAEHVVARSVPKGRNGKKKRLSGDEALARPAPVQPAVQPLQPLQPAQPAQRVLEPEVIIQPSAPPEPVASQPLPMPPFFTAPAASGQTLAIFCFDDQGSVLGDYISKLASQLAQRNSTVHLFCRKAFVCNEANVRVHAVGECPGPNLLASAYEFATRARNVFATALGPAAVTLFAQEWASIPALLECAGQSHTQAIISLHSLEPQRSDMSSEMSQKIKAIELQGIALARTVLFHQSSTAETAKRLAPDSAKKLVLARQPFPVQNFVSNLDPGEIKKRVQVGPIDPLVLFIGPLDERHGPDLLMKAAATILKNNRQARFAFVGDGHLLWPLRVHSRYLLLDYATRVLGHMSGQGLHELIHACDAIIAPSRELTDEWPVLAGWAAKKPVIASHNATKSLIEHEKDGLLIYPSENSLVWGLERVLQNAELRTELGRSGHQKLQQRYGFNSIAQQVEELMGVRAGK